MFDDAEARIRMLADGAATASPTGGGSNNLTSASGGTAAASPSSVNDSAIIRETFRVYGALYLSCFVAFCLLRRLLPRLFSVRSWVPELRAAVQATGDDEGTGDESSQSQSPTDQETEPLARRENASYGILSWCWKVFHVDDDALLSDCGMDALCFIRAVRFGRNLSLLGCFNAVWLLPLYAWQPPTASSTSTPAVPPMTLISISNVPPSSPRFIGTILAAYLIFLGAMWLLYREMIWFIKYRHKFLSQRLPRNYAVYVSGIPKQYRSSQGLARYFRFCSYYEGGVLEAHIAMNIPDLEAKVARRAALVERLEHAVAVERRMGVKSTHLQLAAGGLRGCWRWPGGGGGDASGGDSRSIMKKVETVATYERQLRSLNREISAGIDEVLNSNDPLPSNGRVDGGGGGGDGNGDSVRQGDSGDSVRQGSVRSIVSGVFDSIRSIDTAGGGGSSGGSGSRSPRDKYGDNRDDELKRILDVDPSSSSLPADDRDGAAAAALSDNMILSPLTDDDMEVSPLSDADAAAAKTAAAAEQGANTSVTNEFGGEPHPLVENRTQSLAAGDDGDGLSLVGDTIPQSRRTSPESDDEWRNERSAAEEGEAGGLSPMRLPASIGEDVRGRSGSEDSSPKELKRNLFPLEERTGLNSSAVIADRVSYGEIDTEAMWSKEDDDGCMVRRIDTMPTQDSDMSDQEQEQLEEKQRNVSFTSSAGSSAESNKSMLLSSVAAAGSAAASLGSRAATYAVSTANTSAVVKSSRAATKTIAKASIQSMNAAQAIGTHVVTSAGTVVPLLLSSTSGSPRNAGFVVFSTLHAAQMALQMVHHPIPFSMDVQEAPNPEDIFWRNVGAPLAARRTGLALSVSATSVLCIFWSFPTAAIASLTEVSSLKNSIPGLATFLEKYPGFESILGLIAPLLLLFINEVILPSVLKYFATWEGHISSAMLEASLFLKLGCFMIIQTFFVSAISGSVFAEITNIINQPTKIIDLLANSLPAQSSYFMQILLTATFLLQSMEFLRVYPLSLALLRRCVGPNLTKKERRRTWWMINSLEDPPLFWHAETFAQMILYYMVFFVYATIAPVTSFFLLFCFVLMESGYRYQFIHNYPRASDTGGRLWRFFVEFTMASMIIAELTLLGMLLLKQSFYTMPAMLPLIAITGLFIIFISREFNHVISYLPTRDCAINDSRRRQDGESLDFLRGAYLQPALKNHVVEPDYEESYPSDNPQHEIV